MDVSDILAVTIGKVKNETVEENRKPYLFINVAIERLKSKAKFCLGKHDQCSVNQFLKTL